MDEYTYALNYAIDNLRANIIGRPDKTNIVANITTEKPIKENTTLNTSDFSVSTQVNTENTGDVVKEVVLESAIKPSQVSNTEEITEKNEIIEELNDDSGNSTEDIICTDEITETLLITDETNNSDDKNAYLENSNSDNVETEFERSDNNVVTEQPIAQQSIPIFDAKEHIKQHGVKLRRTSIVLSIIALISSVSIIFGLLFGILSVIFALLYKKAAYKLCTKEQISSIKEYEKTGLKLGIISIVLSIIFGIFLFVFFVFFADFSQTVFNLFPGLSNNQYLNNFIGDIQYYIDSIKTYWNI